MSGSRPIWQAGSIDKRNLNSFPFEAGITRPAPDRPTSVLEFEMWKINDGSETLLKLDWHGYLPGKKEESNWKGSKD